MFGEEIVDTLSHKYRVQRATVLDALSQVLAGPVFQRATGARFGEITADGVMVFGLRGAGLLGEPRRSLTRLLSYELERKLSDAATAAEYTEWKPVEGHLIMGRIDRVEKNGALQVVIERTGIFGETVSEILAHCKKRYLPPHERKAPCLGKIRCFLVDRVMTIRQRTGTKTIAIQLSRTSGRMVTKLLRRELAKRNEKAVVSCEKRVAGRVSYVKSNARIPVEVIHAVGKELGERVKVEYIDPLIKITGKKGKNRYAR